MKRKTLTFIGVLILALTTLTMNAFLRKDKTGQATDADGHVLTELWADYAKAVLQDRPKRQADILAQIREQAMEQRLAYDFFDASRRYVDAVTNRDWKLRDTLRAEFAENVRKFGSPVVTFAWMAGHDTNVEPDSIFRYVQDNAKALKAGHEKSFYSTVIVRYRSLAYIDRYFLNDFYANDYEYALWQLLPYTSSDKVTEGDIYKALKAYEGESYPLGAYLEYLEIRNGAAVYDSAQEALLKEYAERYSGKAISMLARADILLCRFNRLTKSKASGNEFRKLYEDCLAFEKERKAFKGNEEKIVEGITSVETLADDLNSKKVTLSDKDGKIQVVLHNLKSVHLTMQSKTTSAKPVIDKVLKNEVCSFYVGDTLTVDIPELNDDDYDVKAESDKVVNWMSYCSSRISVASRTDSRGLCIYAADYKSGEPLKSADIELMKNGKKIASYKGFSFNGFTPLPAEILAKMKGDSRYALVCSFTDASGFLHKSNEISLRGGASVPDEYDEEQDDRSRACSIYTDRGAYNPGDTVDFKAVIYYTDLINSAEVSPAGAKYKVLLVNAEDKEMDSLSLMTNEFGSIAGRFVIPKDERNGYWRIEVVNDSGLSVGTFTKSFRVDEFILPTFDVAFDKDDKIHLPGDEVIVTGKVESYAGHPVSSDNAVYEVESYGKRAGSGALEIAPDGTFSVKFHSDEKRGWSTYRVTVRISDSTGETYEYGKSVRIVGQVNVNASLVNAAEGKVSDLDKFDRGGWYIFAPSILKEDTASVKLSVDSGTEGDSSVRISYSIENERGQEVASSSVWSGTIENIDMKSLASGLYTLKTSASVRSESGKEYCDTTKMKFLLVREGDNVLDASVKDLIVPLKQEVNAGEQAELLFGTADGAPVWALAEVFGKNAELLETRMVRLSGIRGEEGSLERLSFDYKDEYPDAIRIQVFYFKDSETVSFGYEYHRARKNLDLPLEFASFEDRTLPASVYTFSVKALPDVECLAAVFDKSTETINPNSWSTFRLNGVHVSYVNVDACPGSVGSGDVAIFNDDLALNEVVVTGYGVRPSRRYKAMALSSRANAPMMDLEEDIAYESAPDSSSADSGENEPVIRENFANALTFQPYLRSDKDGNLSFSFSTSDKLSTYIVSLFAHDRTMHNAALRREMMVTIPMKVSVVEPKYLYLTDKYRLAASVSSVADKPVTGTLTLYIYEGGDYKALAGKEPLSVQSVRVTVPAGESIRSEFEVNVADLLRDAVLPSDLGFKVVFVADKSIDPKTGRAEGGFSDGIFVSVPVYPATQTLTESHSAVLLSGMDKDALIARLRGEFRNVPGSDAEVNVISLLDMLRDALPSKVEPEGKDVLSLSEALYVRDAAYKLGALSRRPVKMETVISDEELYGKIFACHNADGGFGWFEGMKSSPVITAVLLERLSKMLSAGFISGDDAVADDAASCKTIEEVLASAVRYMDKEQFSGSDVRPLWCGGVSDAQYMYVRSMFSSVPFDVKALTGKDIDKRLKVFRKDAVTYLVPKKERGLNGYILGKARRLSTLRNLVMNDGGIALAKAWGLGINIDTRLSKSVEADVVSLLEYAVDHKDGGVYYPNAVMPFRGLLESEAYAHSMLCDLLADYAFDASSTPEASMSANVKEALRVSDGIRLWLMLQKETQHWDAEPAFVDAINSVMNGSPAMKSTSVVTLTKTYTKPFFEVNAAGNGFSIERRFFREVAKDNAEGKITREEIRPGEVLHVGDKIVAEYRIHNDENRSFVKVTVPREAAFRPADQLSGHYGWWLSPLRVAGWYSFVPQGYRNVKADRTEYMFDSYPEENTVISEELFVTQTGEFSAPTVTVESLYAPHYRANAGFCGTVDVD